VAAPFSSVRRHGWLPLLGCGAESGEGREKKEEGKGARKDREPSGLAPAVFSFNGADGHHGSRRCHSRGKKEKERGEGTK
jgi:hypothetical protein